MKKLEEFIPHLSICLLLCLGVFTVLDSYNPGMKWLSLPVSHIYIGICILVGLVTALLLIARQRRRRRK